MSSLLFNNIAKLPKSTDNCAVASCRLEKGCQIELLDGLIVTLDNISL